MRSRLAAVALAVVAAAWSADVAPAESPPAVKRTVLQRHDLSQPGHEGVMVQVELPAGAREGRHTHPAEVFVYVLAGAPTLEVEGLPAVTLKVGDSFYIEPGKVHEGINKSDEPAKLVAVFVAEKGKPLTTPAK